MDAVKELKNLDRSDILGALGLQSKADPVDYILPVIGIFGAGLLIGTGLGMLVAPSTGRAMRKKIGRQVADVTDRAVSVIEEVRSH